MVGRLCGNVHVHVHVHVHAHAHVHDDDVVEMTLAKFSVDSNLLSEKVSHLMPSTRFVSFVPCHACQRFALIPPMSMNALNFSAPHVFL